MENLNLEGFKKIISNNEKMKVGHSRYCLSPTGEFYLIGYRSKNRNYPAKGIHDDIYCNSLLFSNNGKEVFLFSADFLEFEEEMAEEVKILLNKEYGIDKESILLSATHNHSSVVSYHKSWYTQKFNQKYYDFLIEIIKKSYEDCKKNLQEATAKYGRKIITGYYGNRNHPGELADNEVIVVKFLDKNGKEFAGFVNLAVHSTVITPNNELLTSELAGNISIRLKEKFGFYPLMLIGAAGDSSNRNERQGDDFFELERVSKGLALEISKIELDKNLELSDRIEINTEIYTIHHNMEEISKKLNSEIEKLKSVLRNGATGFEKEKAENSIKDYNKKLEIKEFHLELKIQVIKIGKMKLFVFPGELGSKFGIELKKEYPDLGIILCYTNGYFEYFMPKEEYGLSFETIGSLVPKGEAEKIIDKFIEISRKTN